MKIKLCLSTLESRENPSGLTGASSGVVANLMAAGVQGAGSGLVQFRTTHTFQVSLAVGEGPNAPPVDTNPMPDVPPMGPPWLVNGVGPIMMSPTGETEGVIPPVASPPVQPPRALPVDQLDPPSID